MISITHPHGEKRVVGQNKQRATVAPTEDNVDRTLWDVDLPNLAARRVVNENLPVSNVHVSFAIDRNALTSSIGAARSLRRPYQPLLDGRSGISSTAKLRSRTSRLCVMS